MHQRRFWLWRFGKTHVSSVGISLGGAFASTLAQIFMSRLMLFGDAVRFIAPVLLTGGFITGLLLGLITGMFMAYSRWFALVLTSGEMQ